MTTTLYHEFILMSDTFTLALKPTLLDRHMLKYSQACPKSYVVSFSLSHFLDRTHVKHFSNISMLISLCDHRY